jgi:transcriptional regulator with XRE-family HTH domain
VTDLQRVDNRTVSALDAEIGCAIRNRRRACKLSQSDLAVAVGLTHQQIQKYEAGADRVSATTLYDIAVALQWPITAFFPQPGARPPTMETAIPGFDALHQIHAALNADGRLSLLTLARAFLAHDRRHSAKRGKLRSNDAAH